MSAGLMFASASELARAIRSREISPVEVLDNFAARIEQRNASVNAFVFLDLDQARERARAAELAVVQGAPLGPLHGVPTAMKDLFDFKPGWPATFGGIPALRILFWMLTVVGLSVWRPLAPSSSARPTAP
jgi:amidase